MEEFVFDENIALHWKKIEENKHVIVHEFDIDIPFESSDNGTAQELIPVYEKIGESVYEFGMSPRYSFKEYVKNK